VPTGIHRPTSRISLVWVFAGVTAVFMVVVTGYAFLRTSGSAPAPIFAGGTASAPPSSWVTPFITVSASPSAAASSPSPSPSASASASPKPATATSFWGDTGDIPKAKNVLTVKVLNRTNGKYPDSQVYWTFNGQTHSIAARPYLDMPANSSGRMYFHLGSPDSKYSDFIEFTVGPDVFNGNTTRVDAFVLKIAMRLHAKDGFDTSVGEDQSVFAESRAATFARFKAAVPAEFDHLAEGQDKILSPGGDPEFRAGGPYADYFKPVSTIPASDILGCAGSLANQPAQCASLNRHGTSYSSAPANFYAKFWHDNAIGHKAYGFPYDDVNSQSSYVSHSDPQWLEVAVGF
jgi:hypothetical protein